MTPRGFKSWIKQADSGRQILYHTGQSLSDTQASEELGRIAREAHEAGKITMFQKRITPTSEINKNTVGEFAWIAVKL